MLDRLTLVGGKFGNMLRAHGRRSGGEIDGELSLGRMFHGAEKAKVHYGQKAGVRQLGNRLRSLSLVLKLQWPQRR